METRRWTNPGQPQTLQIAVFLLYINAFFMVLYGGVLSVLGLAITIATVAAGWGIANEQRWGYNLGVLVSLLPFVFLLLFSGVEGLFSSNPISLLFDIALVALLLHPQSREYQKIWFR